MLYFPVRLTCRTYRFEHRLLQQHNQLKQRGRPLHPRRDAQREHFPARAERTIRSRSINRRSISSQWSFTGDLTVRATVARCSGEGGACRSTTREQSQDRTEPKQSALLLPRERGRARGARTQLRSRRCQFTHDNVRRLTGEIKSHKQFDWFVFPDGVEQLWFDFFSFS